MWRLEVRFPADMPSIGTNRYHYVTPASVWCQRRQVQCVLGVEGEASWSGGVGAEEKGKAVLRSQRENESWALSLLFSNLQKSVCQA